MTSVSVTLICTNNCEKIYWKDGSFSKWNINSSHWCIQGQQLIFLILSLLDGDVTQSTEQDHAIKGHRKKIAFPRYFRMDLPSVCVIASTQSIYTKVPSLQLNSSGNEHRQRILAPAG